MASEEYPVLLHFEEAEHACQYYAPLEHRCQNVILHYDEIPLYSVMPREYQFEFGTLKFFVLILRVFKFRGFFMADYKLKITHFANSTYPYVYTYNRDDGEANKLSLLGRKDPWLGVYHVTGWFSFVFDKEYYSFNFVNVEGNHTLLAQHWGPFEERQFWDTIWRNGTAAVHENWQKAEGWELANQLANQGKVSRRRQGSTTKRPPRRGRKLKFEKSDGLFQYVLQQHFVHNYSLQYNFFMLDGHRDSTTVARISVTIQFSHLFMQRQGIYNFQHYAMALLAIRTINELNGIFKRSGTLIELYIHCIEQATIIDACCVRSRQVLEAYAKPKERKSSDLLIAFVHELEDQFAISYSYRLDEKVAVAVIKSNSLFEVNDIAHEIGHVLGAGHTPDPDYAVGAKPQIWYAQGYIDQESNRCTIMSAMPCTVQPIFSHPENGYKNETWGKKRWQDNAGWIKQNRFVWQVVGYEDQMCKVGDGINDMPYIPWLIRCFTMDVTNASASTGIFKTGTHTCHFDFAPWNG